MATTAIQLNANRNNAAKSTGPKTGVGKSRSSQNAMKHGLLSRDLLLKEEDPDDFACLLRDLNEALKPSGVLECGLTERIAITLWRQRRLVRAETAILELERKDVKIAQDVSREIDQGYRSVGEDDLVPFDQDLAEWCQSILDEYETVETFNLNGLVDDAPLIYQQLKSDAEDDQEKIEEYLSGSEQGLSDYLSHLVRWCRDQIRKSENRPKIIEVAELVRSRSVVPPGAKLNLFTRYQTSLDNQLYKAIQALKQAQDWRMKTLDVEILETDDEETVT